MLDLPTSFPDGRGIVETERSLPDRESSSFREVPRRPEWQRHAPGGRVLFLATWLPVALSDLIEPLRCCGLGEEAGDG